MKHLLLILIGIPFFSCSQKKAAIASDKGQTAIVVSYNVENLFDTINDVKKNDEDFLPEGKLNWNTEKYLEKLNRIGQAISNNKSEFPDIVGLIEIENKTVLKDLCNNSYLKEGEYDFIWFEGPDERGIDVALLYRKKNVTILSSNAIPVILKSDTDPNTRDILHVEAKIGDLPIHFYVNHWPSRRGGQTQSEPFRLQAAEILKKEIDSQRKKNSNANIICMGDFNDFPSNSSLKDVLRATDINHLSESDLINLMSDDELAKDGTHFYQNEWSMLDQFIVSKNLFDQALSAESASIVKYDFLYYTNKNGVKSPSRSYVGDSYKGGYSDHLPIKLIVRVSK
jgi:predicted extracellular nuclease